MGQQQLLLLVLATVIVGLATVAGIQAFEQGSTRANQDALTQTAVKIASDMQAQAKKPGSFGGKGLDDLSNISSDITLKSMGYDVKTGGGDYASGNYYETTDGECEITQNGSGSAPPLKVKCHSADATATVTVSGLNSSDIETTGQTIK